eukprot:3870446-Rhodomonas_salina.1
MSLAQFAINKAQGRGQLWFPDGTKIAGLFNQDVITVAKHRFKDGTEYSGQLLMWQFDGEGRLQLPSGDVYAGQFKKGRFSGQGEYVSRTGERYQGGFAD